VTEETPESRRILEGQLRECYGRVVYTHKTQEKCADILLRQQRRIKMWQIGLSVVTTAGFVGAVFGAGQAGSLIGLVVSMILLALNSYTKDYDLGAIAQKHKEAASALWLIRESYLSLLVDIAIGKKPLETLQAQRDELAKQLHEAYKSAPSTSVPGAYKEAQTGLQKMEEMTFTDGEIDAFLPKELRRSSPASDVLKKL
jgi:hypothetical protein